MVQSAAAQPQWPRLSPRVTELFRRGAEVLLDPRAEWLEQLQATWMSGDRMRPVVEDPVLTAAMRRANLANLVHWSAANVEDPGARVPANTAAEVLAATRDLVRRGLDGSVLAAAYRTGQSLAWRRWMEICFDLTPDPAELRELLDASAASMSTFVDDTVAAVSERIETERAELTRGASAERRAAVTLLLEGAPISRARAEAQLGYGLTGSHTAAIVWNTSGASDHLEAAAETLLRASGATHRLTVVASAASLWIWFPVGAAPRVGDVAAQLSRHSDVRVAVGRPGTDVDGFRRSHLDAATTQRMLARLTSPQQIARFEDVQLISLLTAEPTEADEFLADTLGDLRHADAATQEAVLTYVRELGNTTRTAERLFTHRNTVLRRLARADELLPRPLEENVVSIAAALEVLRWRGAG
jgi:DNA-binding PucR family transcriptional regulator